jgi:hypothetical protein
MIWRAIRVYPTGVFDFYPLYYGGQAWLHTGNAYALESVVAPELRNFQLYQIGNVYPFPAVVLTLPFSLLPAQLTAVLWTGLLCAGLLLAMRLHDWPLWYLAYLPVVEGLRIEQYTMFVVIFQVLGLWAWRERRPWLLALCSTVILTKPNHALFFVLALTFLAGNWRQFLAFAVPFYGLTLAIYPHWVLDWIPRLQNSHAVLHQAFYWQLALLAIPLLLMGDVIGGAMLLQFVLLPYPGSYSSAAIPFGVLGDRRSRWLIPIAVVWMIAGLLVGTAWATFLTIVLPVLALSGLRWWERRPVPEVRLIGFANKQGNLG